MGESRGSFRAGVVRGVGTVIGGLALGFLVSVGTGRAGSVATLVLLWLVGTAACVAVVLDRARRLRQPPSVGMLLRRPPSRRAQHR